MGKSLIGKKIGFLTVKGTDRYSNYKRWICECSLCGSTMSLSPRQIRKGNCGCVEEPPLLTKDFLRDMYVVKKKGITEISRETGLHRNTVSKYIDDYRLKPERANSSGPSKLGKKKLRTGPKPHKLLGETIGNLTVIRYIDISTVECRCVCGKTIRVPVSKLSNLEVTSCGCKETIHKGTDDILYIMWDKMLRQEKTQRWGTFEQFIKWSADNGYAYGLVLVENEEGDYQWVSQPLKYIRANSIIIDVCGVSQTLTDWVKLLDLDYKHIYNRYKNGFRGKDLFIENICRLSDVQN
jgi:hypothetical protein